MKYEIINAHCHVYPAKIARKAAANIGLFYGYEVPEFQGGDPGTLEALLYEGREAGLSGYCVSGAATSPAQVQPTNDSLLLLLHSPLLSPGESLFCFGTVHPEFNGVESELQRIQAAGALGIKLHPDCQRFNIDDRSAYTIYESAQALRLPILMHLGDESHDFSDPRRLVKVCSDFPNLRFIAAHLGGYRDWQNGLLLRGLENVWFDTCSSQSILPPETAVNQIRAFGAERCFFGSDYPLWSVKPELEAFLKLGLSDRENELILALNFKRFINAY
ncbi:MAG: amidohydrolase family protein [Oscillospiraceae bacterium]|jgi:hypothetical protein|nr:amidohydrolase family protein [Oscillospiraceae bacterium]